VYRLALFFHLVGAILFFSGLAVAAVAQAGARRRTRPAEIAALLATARVGVIIVGLGFLLVLGFGFWLVDLTGYGLDGWVLASLGLLGFAIVAGAAGGQAPKRARKVAAALELRGDRMSPELAALLRDRRSALLNQAAAVAAIAILVLMVWKPGS
jgi:uncharacterized membrane protein